MPTPMPAQAPRDRPEGAEFARGEEGVEVEEEEVPFEVPLHCRLLIRPCCCCETRREQLKSAFQASIETVPETKVREGRMLGPEELFWLVSWGDLPIIPFSDSRTCLYSPADVCSPPARG